VCKQLAQGYYPMEQWRDPGFEPRSPGLIPSALTTTPASHTKVAKIFTIAMLTRIRFVTMGSALQSRKWQLIGMS